MINFIKSQYGGKKAFLRYWKYALLNLLTGKYKKYSVMPNQVNRIVFVCKGNICRSALAEWVFKSLSNVPCCSVGVDTTSGVAANERISLIAKDVGFDLNEHKTTAIDDFVSQPNDLFVCMEPVHVAVLKKKLQTDNIYLLGLVNNRMGVYIHDPYAASDQYAESCVKNIIQLSSKLAAEIK